jgi:hypothetical protein
MFPFPFPLKYGVSIGPEEILPEFPKDETGWRPPPPKSVGDGAVTPFSL